MGERIVSSEFRCPKCGGRNWGTSSCTESFSKWIGHCNSLACGFTWKRSRDDWRYFVFTVRPTRAEYQRFEQRAARPTPDRVVRRSHHPKVRSDE